MISKKNFIKAKATVTAVVFFFATWIISIHTSVKIRREMEENAQRKGGRYEMTQNFAHDKKEGKREGCQR